MTESSRRTFLTLGLFAALAVVAAVSFRRLERPHKAIPENAMFTKLDVVPLAGGAQPLALADLAGKTVLVNFWGTWCPPCREEFPYIAALEKQYRDRSDFKLLSISATGFVPEDIADLKQETEKFLSRGQFDVPVYADPLSATRRNLPEGVDSGVYPMTILIDRTGKIVGAWEGFYPAEFDQIKLQVAGLIAQSK